MYNYRTKKRSASLRQILSIMFKHSRKIRILIPLELFFLITDGFIVSRLPALLKYVVDGLKNGHDSFIQNNLSTTILSSLAISFGYGIVAIIQHYLKEKNSTTIMVGVQLSLYEHIQNLSMEFYQSTYIGEITNRLTNDIYQSVKEIYGTFTNLLWLAALVVPSLITMASYDMTFFIAFLTLMLFFSLFLLLILPIVRKKRRLAMDQMGTINAKITESVYSMMLIKSFARENDFADKIQKESLSFLDKHLKAVRIRILGTDLTSMLIGYLAPSSLLWIGALLRIEVGIIVAFYTYWFSTGGRIQQVLNLMDRATSAFASFDRVFEFFQHSPMVQDDPNPTGLTITEGKVSFENVSFTYPSVEKTVNNKVINNFSLHLPGKGRIAIVGKSGCGKTTLLNLLLRFFDPDNGKITIDNQDIKLVGQKNLRSQIGLVMQETLLLNGTVRENMLFVRPDADDNQIRNALEQAKIWEYFKNSAEGLDSVVGERGVRLSGGQKQRISIARIFLKNPAIVLLDEATASMDSETEKSIMESMDTMLEGRTSIIISHRLSTVRNCDLIVVLDNGRIIDKGNHSDLINRCDLYHDLCMQQDLAEE